MIRKISQQEYIDLLASSLESDIKSKILSNVSVSATIPDGVLAYYKSDQGCSTLRVDGELAGLFRFKKGNENLSSIHQLARIVAGGHWLNCYDGKLVELYKSQGFEVVARVPFDEQQATHGWELEDQLKSKPDLVFMSVNKKPCISTKSYVIARRYASDPKEYLIRIKNKNGDKSNFKLYSWQNVLEALNTSEETMSAVNESGSVSYYTFKEHKNTIVVASKFKQNQLQ